MTFDEVLARVLDLLQRQGRVSYRALRRRFGLDEEYLEDLKAEIIKAKKLAVDEAGEVLVWTGDARGAPAPVSPEPQPVSQPASQGAQAMQAEAPSATPPPDAERRQLTVLFCDLVDSTVLASQFDPEDLREVVRAYQDTCARVIARFEGHIAQYLGDGLLVYFGYPLAHEDDAQRAVRTGLGIVEALGQLNTHLGPERGVHLAVRLGIHTGLVVVGDIGRGSHQEQLALGETPNLAARLQGLAAPDTVVVSAATFRLVRGYFTAQELGAHTLKGVTEPVQVYRMLGESAAQSRLDIAGPAGLTPLVGRESEVLLLLERWAHSQDGRGQVVLLSGEAGIGKSRLVEVLREHVISQGATRMVFRCSPYHQQSALYPVIDHLQRFLHWDSTEDPDTRLTALDQALRTSQLPLEEVTPLLAALLSLPHPAHYPPLNLSPQRQRQKTYDALVAWLLAEAERQPVLAVWEDLHWADPSTLELLELLLGQAPTARVVLVLTCRPEFQPSWPPRSYMTTLTLTRLTRRQVEELVLRVTGGKPLPAEVLRQIVAKTDGIPLFVEELVKTILESGLVREEDSGYMLAGPLPPLAIPATLQDALMARLDRLAAVKEVAQLCATLGREFAYEVLRAVSPLDEGTLQDGLAQLVEAELLHQRGIPPQATYVFKHALIQEAAYQSLLRSTRQHYHQRIAQVLEGCFAERCETQPELLAYHYTEAGLPEQALPYWQRAGERAVARSAYHEAINHFTRGLEALYTLPETPARAQCELALHLALGMPLQATKGYTAPEVGRTYARARELCQQVGDMPHVFPALWGLWRFYLAGGEARTAHELAEQCFSLAQHAQDTGLLIEAHQMLGISLYRLGEIVPALTHFEHGLALYTPQHHALAFLYGDDPRVVFLARAAVAQWVLGYPDQALQRSHDALILARELSHPFSLGYALAWTVMVPVARHEGPTVSAWTEDLIVLATEREFTQLWVYGTILRGWVLAAQGQAKEGIVQMQEGLSVWRALGVKAGVPYFLALLAEAYGAWGHAEDGLRQLTEALTVIHDTGERYDEAEVHRLKGDLLLRQADPAVPQAAACFQEALTVARRQQAKSWELRAAMSLSRLWQQQGKQAEARELLAPIYNWFTEGFDTIDLQEARALLEKLS